MTIDNAGTIEGTGADAGYGRCYVCRNVSPMLGLVIDRPGAVHSLTLLTAEFQCRVARVGARWNSPPARRSER